MFVGSDLDFLYYAGSLVLRAECDFLGAVYHDNNNFVNVLVVVIFVVIIIHSLIIGKRWLGSDCHRDLLLATIPGYPPRSHPSADGNHDY